MQTTSRAIIASALLGVLVSTYALYVEMAAEARPGYQAFCDIGEFASCSRVLTSEYSKGFGIITNSLMLEVPNCIYGTLFYSLIIMLATFDHKAVVRLQLFLCVAACASSIYLAYLLAFVLHDLCVVCVSTYFINSVLLMLVYKKLRLLKLKTK